MSSKHKNKKKIQHEPGSLGIEAASTTNIKITKKWKTTTKKEYQCLLSIWMWLNVGIIGVNVWTGIIKCTPEHLRGI